MPLQIKELSFLKGVDHWTPEIGAKLAEALLSIQQAHNNVEAQVNGNSTGGPQPPPAIQGVQVTGQNGYLHVAIQHDAPIYRGIRYYVEHSDNPHFKNPQVVALHDVRNVTIPVGGTRYVRAYAAYSSSSPSEPVYHGSAVQPIAVNAGTGGPALLPSQGSGTGTAGVGLEGPGKRPFRPIDGVQPIRQMVEANAGIAFILNKQIKK
jgi:hypothetical protein